MEKKQLRRRVLLIASVLFIALLGIFYLVSKNTEMFEKGSESSLGAKYREAPSFELPDSKGKLHALEEFRGKLILLHFWATWCPPCVDEIPVFLDLARKYEDSQIRFLMVSLDDKWEDARKMINEENLPKSVTSLLDQEGKVPDEYGSFQYPETYLISPDLRILTKWVGPQEWHSPEMLSFLDRIVTKKAP